ncbi:class I SAM-dependent methyltransferase [Kiloniella majae]|uniref:class I SAM-dependent methyltransferase n=1 Tax=Kiloniella majae TaxID=1938558 RepID=UPI000A27857C|nr:class I SAM-dependent methyltransferase [Kiloniella majae]
MSDQDVKSAVRDWWADNPMTYGQEHGVTDYVDPDGTVRKVEFGSREFFETADKTFFQWNLPLHNDKGTFGKIFDYEKFRGKNVLEVGCGMGYMAMNWAQQGAKVTALDLNPVAIVQTTSRFKAFDLPGEIIEGDGRSLPFEDNKFAHVYSWGVLHHSPNIESSLAEVFRVVEPGGTVGVMLYNRNSFLFRYIVQYLEGIVNLEHRVLSPLEMGSRYGDGDRREGNPHTWPVTIKEAKEELFAQFEDINVEVFGTDVAGIVDHFFPLLASRLMPKPLLNALIRRWGWSLWITARKPK